MNKPTLARLTERWGLYALLGAFGGALIYVAFSAWGAPSEIAKAVQALPLDPWMRLAAVACIALIGWIGGRLVAIGKRINEQLQNPASNRSLRQDLDDIVTRQTDFHAILADIKSLVESSDARSLRVEAHAQGIEAQVDQRLREITSIIEDLAKNVASAMRYTELERQVSESAGYVGTIVKYLAKKDPDFRPRRDSDPSFPTEAG